MLNIRNVKHLATYTGFTVSRLHELHDTASTFYEELSHRQNRFSMVNRQAS